MRAAGLWHAELVRLILSLRHGETVVIADAGLPVPSPTPTIDLGWARHEPRLLPVLRAVLAELVVERATIAKQADDEEFLIGLRAELGAVPVGRTDHEALKADCATARAVVRTGEDTPYANVILHAGIPFGPQPARAGLPPGSPATQGGDSAIRIDSRDDPSKLEY
jgi:D-ribose pyranase